MKVNVEKINAQARRRGMLEKKYPDLIKKMDEVDYFLDTDLVTMEGMEVENGLRHSLEIRLVLTRSSGRLYLEISYPEAMTPEHLKQLEQEGTRIVSPVGFDKVPITVVDT